MKLYLQAGLLIAYLATFALFLDNNSLSPLIAPYAQALGASVALTGVISGAYSASNLSGNLRAGCWVDRIGRRLPLVIGLPLRGQGRCSILSPQVPTCCSACRFCTASERP